MTRREPNGRSSKVRWYVLCLRLACFPAVRAPARTSRRHRLHRQDVGGVVHAFHSHIDPGKQHSIGRLAYHARKHSAETIPRSPR